MRCVKSSVREQTWMFTLHAHDNRRKQIYILYIDKTNKHIDSSF